MADPQYPSYRSVPSVLEFMQSMDQQRQDIQHSKADTQLLNIKVLMGQQEIAAQQQHQQAVEEYLRSERIAEAQGGPINQNNPMAPAVAGQPPSWWTPVDQSVKDLTVERNKFERQMSKATNLGLTDEVKTLRPLFDNTVTRLREASKEQATQRETQFKQTAQMLNSAKTAEQITTAMDYIKDKMPPEVWKKSDSMLLHNPDGSYLWNDQQAQRVATLGSAHTTVAEQNTDKYHDALLAGQAEERSRKVLSDQERKNYHDARIAGGQHGVAGGGEPVQLTEDTLTMDAYRYLTDGTLPTNMGRGTQGAAQATKIRNEASRLAKEMGMEPDEIRLAQLTNKAQVGAIAQLARAKAQILQFEKTAAYNSELALKASNEATRSGVPLLNRGVQWAQENLAGDPTLRKFTVANETFISEYARVMSGGYGAAQTTEGAQKRAHELLSRAATQEEYRVGIKQLRDEMSNRVRALDDQMKEERANLRGGVRPKTAETASAKPTTSTVTPTAASASQYLEIRRTADGRLFGKKPNGDIEEVKQ